MKKCSDFYFRLIKIFWINPYLHWQSLAQKSKRKCLQQWHVKVTTVLALTTLGDATQNRTNLICDMSPKIAKASKVGIFVVQNSWQFCQQTLPMYSSLNPHVYFRGESIVSHSRVCHLEPRITHLVTKLLRIVCLDFWILTKDLVVITFNQGIITYDLWTITYGLRIFT